MNHVFDSYQPYKGDIDQRNTGSLIAYETGEATSYGLFNTQGRGRLFIGPGTPVYEGMIVGENPKNEDIICNVCKKKHMTNTRSAGADEALRLVTPTIFSLEQSLEFIKPDELVEITPHHIRLRKRILDKEQRFKYEAKNRKEEIINN
jgi:GTP-binding protein